MHQDKIQRITVKAILCKNNKILLVRDQKGKWELPGGRIEFGENIDETLKRELAEELGLKDFKIGDIVDIWSFLLHDHGMDHQFIVLIYECFISRENFKLGGDYSFCNWFDINQLNVLIDNKCKRPVRE
jgi:8-oxo-dGTP diphosphatase